MGCSGSGDCVNDWSSYFRRYICLFSLAPGRRRKPETVVLFWEAEESKVVIATLSGSWKSVVSRNKVNCIGEIERRRMYWWATETEREQVLVAHLPCKYWIITAVVVSACKYVGKTTMNPWWYCRIGIQERARANQRRLAGWCLRTNQND
jgi:hypothetical protein